MSVFILLMLAQVAAAPSANSKTPCFVQETQAGVEVSRYGGDRACVDFDPSRTISGVWINAFEGSAFYEGARSLAEIRGRTPVWLTLDAASQTPGGFPKGRFPPHAYRLTFVGKTAKDMHRPPLSGYGHMGLAPGLALVDEVIDWEDLGAAE